MTHRAAADGVDFLAERRGRRPSSQHSRFTQPCGSRSDAAVPHETNDLSFDYSVLITAAPTRVLAAFFIRPRSAPWWQTARSATTARPLGIYAVEWEPTVELDDLLGRLGGSVLRQGHGISAGP